MKRAFRYNGEDMELYMQNYTAADSPAVSYMKKYQNRSVTENGAVGYKTTTHLLADLNFMVSSLRNRDENILYGNLREHIMNPQNMR